MYKEEDVPILTHPHSIFFKDISVSTKKSTKMFV